MSILPLFASLLTKMGAVQSRAYRMRKQGHDDGMLGIKIAEGVLNLLQAVPALFFFALYFTFWCDLVVNKDMPIACECKLIYLIMLLFVCDGLEHEVCYFSLVSAFAFE